MSMTKTHLHCIGRQASPPFVAITYARQLRATAVPLRRCACGAIDKCLTGLSKDGVRSESNATAEAIIDPIRWINDGLSRCARPMPIPPDEPSIPERSRFAPRRRTETKFRSLIRKVEFREKPF